MANKDIDKKKFVLMLIPVLLLMALFTLFFGIGKKSQTTDKQSAGIFEPESEEEVVDGKVSAYDKDKREKNDSSPVRGSDFYQDMKNREQETYEQNARRRMSTNIYEDMLSSSADDTTVASVSSQFRKNIDMTSRQQTVESILKDAARRGELDQKIADNEQLRQELAALHNLPANDPSVDGQPTLPDTLSQVEEIPEEIIENMIEPEGVFIVNEEGKRKRRPKDVPVIQNNLIRACVHGDQTLISGGVARLRLLESITVNGKVIPRNAIIYGIVGVGSNRLRIIIENIQAGEEANIPVSFIIYDNDGMEGLNLPNNLKAEAKKQMERGMLSGIQLPLSSIGTVTSEIASAVNATTQVIRQVLNSSISLIKVDLKANYQLYIQEETKDGKRSREQQEKEDMDTLIQDLQEPSRGNALELLLHNLNYNVN